MTDLIDVFIMVRSASYWFGCCERIFHCPRCLRRCGLSWARMVQTSEPRSCRRFAKTATSCEGMATTGVVDEKHRKLRKCTLFYRIMFELRSGRQAALIPCVGLRNVSQRRMCFPLRAQDMKPIHTSANLTHRGARRSLYNATISFLEWHS